MPISPGDTAPDFTLPRDGGGEVTLSALRPTAVVLYFYPKDDTSGCTKEAQGFTEAKADFEAAGAVVVGVSKDSAEKHDKFVAKYDLDADSEGGEGTIVVAIATGRGRKRRCTARLSWGSSARPS